MVPRQPRLVGAAAVRARRRHPPRPRRRRARDAMRLLLLGGTGQVGDGVSRARRVPKDVEVVAPSTRRARSCRRARAIAEIDRGRALERGHQRRRLYRCRSAESEEAAAFAVNAEAPARLAAETGRRGIPLDSYLDRLCVRRAQGRALCRGGCGGAAQCLWPQQACGRARRPRRQSAARHPAHVLGLQPLSARISSRRSCGLPASASA